MTPKSERVTEARTSQVDGSCSFFEAKISHMIMIVWYLDCEGRMLQETLVELSRTQRVLQVCFRHGFLIFFSNSDHKSSIRIS